MKREQLQRLLNAEIETLSRWSYAKLLEELVDIWTYQRGSGPDYHQFEVQLLERHDDYVHVAVSIDDGSIVKSISPLSHSFIVYRNGRVEI